MSRERGVGYIPDKGHVMSSTLTMLEFFRDGEKSLFQFSAFLKSIYGMAENTIRMTKTTLCRWKLLHEVDFKTYALTDIGTDLLSTHSEVALGRQIQISTLYFGEILQELESKIRDGATLKQIGIQKYDILSISESDFSCRTQYLIGLGFIERSSRQYRITSQGRDFLQLLRDEKLLSEQSTKPYEMQEQSKKQEPKPSKYINLELTSSFIKKCQKQKISPEFVLHELMSYYADNTLSFGIQFNEKSKKMGSQA